MRKLLATLALLLLPVVALAHSGRTDSSGGHYNRSTGEYHYHHGYPEHQHTDGQCPYEKKEGTTTSKTSSTTQKQSSSVANLVTGSEKNDNMIVKLLFAALGGFFVGLIIVAIHSKNEKDYIAKIKKHYEDLIQQEKQKFEQVSRSRMQDLGTWGEIENGYKEKLLNCTQQIGEYERDQSYLITLLCDLRDGKISKKEVTFESPDTKPDISQGVVYAKADMSGALYHHDPLCEWDLCLVSKKSAKFLGMGPCPRCSSYMEPSCDPTVYKTYGHTSVYHAKECKFTSHLPREPFKLSEAVEEGLRPCSKCKPPVDYFKVWY